MSHDPNSFKLIPEPTATSLPPAVDSWLQDHVPEWAVLRKKLKESEAKVQRLEFQIALLTDQIESFRNYTKAISEASSKLRDDLDLRPKT